MTDDKMQLQWEEFEALRGLISAANSLPAVVDDDYPECRHNYEGALRTFLTACKNNGRLATPVPAPSVGWVLVPRELTPEMYKAATDEWSRGWQEGGLTFKELLHSMIRYALAAAPPTASEDK